MLRVGTDFSGMDAPLEALKQLKIPYKHVFSCDIDKHCQKTILANTNPDHLYTDISTRDVMTVPDVDLYVFTPPCVAFSIAGNRKGFDDIRGTLFFHSFNLLKVKRPPMFIMENVRGLINHDNGNTFKRIIECLESLNDEVSVEEKYTIKYKVYNTRDFGIPQSRTRVYLVGIKGRTFELPTPKFAILREAEQFSPAKPAKIDDLTDYIDWTDTHRDEPSDYVKASGVFNRIPEDSVFINLSFPKDNFPNSNIECSCITAHALIWCVPLHRYANCKELLRLQGFSTDFKQVVSERQFKKQIGNSMSINVVKAVLTAVL